MLSKSQARAFFLGGTGIFTAAFLALSYDSIQQMPKMTNQDKLTPEVIAGKKLWEDNNCMGCHTLFGEGAYYAPELTKVVERRGKVFMRAFLKNPVSSDESRRKMVNYHFTDKEVEDLIAFFDWCGQVDLNGFPAKPPLGRVANPEVTHAKVKQPEVFTSMGCIACHSVGGKGGKIGPELDTVATRLDRAYLKKWISDPQKIKPGTAMPKLPLTPEQLTEVLDYLEALAK